ncbi:MAG: capsular biosynthesis protein [Chloroflexi bacterium]|nr:capsular biosynthesis protein [Chloroflexota bacterium]
MLASAIGLSLSLGAAFLIEYLDDTVKTPEQVQAVLKVPTLTAIGRIHGEAYAEKLVAVHEPRSPLTEAYRQLRTNLQFSALDINLKSVLLTSPGPMEGKSVNAANLAVVLAQAGMSVVLVDCDLRRPVQHKVFGLTNSNGLTNLLMARDGMPGGGRRLPGMEALPAPTPFSLDGALQESGIRGLRILTSGPLPPNPAEVLGSERMRLMLETLEQQTDIVVFDSPPCVTVTDPVVLGRLVDGVILILEAGRTRRVLAERAGENLRSVGAKLLGVVVNRVTPHLGGYAYYNYYSPYYYSGDDGKGGKPKNGRKKPPAKPVKPAKPVPAAPPAPASPLRKP